MTPAEFIPLAEQEGLITQVTDYVINMVFDDLGSGWQNTLNYLLQLICLPPIFILQG